MKGRLSALTQVLSAVIGDRIHLNVGLIRHCRSGLDLYQPEKMLVIAEACILLCSIYRSTFFVFGETIDPRLPRLVDYHHCTALSASPALPERLRHTHNNLDAEFTLERNKDDGYAAIIRGCFKFFIGFSSVFYRKRKDSRSSL